MLPEWLTKLLHVQGIDPDTMPEADRELMEKSLGDLDEEQGEDIASLLTMAAEADPDALHKAIQMSGGDLGGFVKALQAPDEEGDPGDDDDEDPEDEDESEGDDEEDEEGDEKVSDAEIKGALKDTNGEGEGEAEEEDEDEDDEEDTAEKSLTAALSNAGVHAVNAEDFQAGILSAMAGVVEDRIAKVERRIGKRIDALLEQGVEMNKSMQALREGPAPAQSPGAALAGVQPVPVGMGLPGAPDNGIPPLAEVMEKCLAAAYNATATSAETNEVRKAAASGDPAKWARVASVWMRISG